MRRGVPVRHLVVDRQLFLVAEAVERFPGGADLRLQNEIGARSNEPEDLMWRLLLDRRVEPERRGERQAPETDVREVARATGFDSQQHVRPRTDGVVRRVPEDAGRQAAHRKTEAPEDTAEQQVVLVAVASTPLSNQLPMQRVVVQSNRGAQQRIEVLERNGRRMQPMERRQRLDRRLPRSGVTDPVEICIEVWRHPEPL